MNDNRNAACEVARRTGFAPMVGLALVLGIVAIMASICLVKGLPGRPQSYREPGWVVKVLEKVLP